MTACPVLPPDLQAKLSLLARRIRLWRLARGLSLTVLTLVVLFAGVFAIDRYSELSPRGMLIALVAVGAAVSVVSIRFLVVPLCARLDAAALAALIERSYPELGERLLSTVELAETQDSAYGSPALIALLQRETVDETRTMNFLRSYPVGALRWLAAAALVAVTLALLPAFASEDYADFARRFWTAWQNRPPFTVEVESCAGFAARGRPLTLSARLVPDRPSRRLPEQCILLYEEGDQPPRRLAMQPGADQRFNYTISQVQDDFRFQIEAGGVLSDEHVVQAIEPVDLATGSPRVTVTPPAYVNKDVHPPQEIQGSNDFAALQFSKVRLHLHFTRPAVTARVHLQDREQKQRLEIPLAWSADRRAVDADVPALDPRTYSLRVTMEAEHQIATVRELGTLRVWADGPPRFIEVPRLLSTSAEETASPDDILPLRVAVEDEVGVDRADVEYRINDGPIQQHEIFRAEGQRQAAREVRFHLAGKVKDGDRLQVRLRASDNRLVPRGSGRDAAGEPVPFVDLKPHVIYEPAPIDGKARWFDLRISRGSATLPENDVLAGQQDVLKRLEAIKRKLARERTLLQQVREAVRGQSAMPPEAARELAETRSVNREVSKDLHELAGVAEKATPFAALADLARDVARREMRAAEQALGKAADPHLEPEPRDAELAQADGHVGDAQKRLEEIGDWMKRLAQDRLDQLQLERLAQREEELSKRAARIAEGQDKSKAKAELADLKAAQQRLIEELQRLAQKSPLFREALQMRSNPAEPLAQQAMKLAQAQRELAKQIRRPGPEGAAKQLALLAQKQQALAKKIKQYGDDLDQAKANLTPSRFDAAAAEQAAQALEQGKLAAALQSQERSQAMLAAVAQRLQDAGASSGDPRKATEQLAQAQQMLRKRLEKLAADLAGLKPEEVVRGLQEIEREQKNVRDRAAKLALPKDNASAEKARALAVDLAGRAADLLKQRDPLQAFEQMEKAQQALEALRNALPIRKDPPAAPKSAAERIVQEHVARAKELAKEQQSLRDDAAALAREMQGSALSPQEAARQHALLEQTNKLADDLREFSRQASSQKAQQMAKEATAAAEKASETMKQVESEAQQGHEEPAKQAADAAAKMLEAAEARAREAGLRLMTDKKSAAPEMEKLANSLQQGEAEAGRGMEQLQKNDPAGASPALKQAASALQQAATQTATLAEQQSTGPRLLPGGQRPAQTAGPTTVLPPGMLPKELEKMSGRAWGELPGELRARLLQDMQARYGEDFARIIQGYFESLAEPSGRRP